MVHIDASDKYLCAFINHNNKPITFYPIILRKPQRDYTTNKKELIAIVECLKQFRRMLFGYEIIFFVSSNSGLCCNPERISKGDALATLS